MHLVHVIARLNDGGPARVLAELGRELAGHGHRVTILSGGCDASEPDLTELVRANGVAVETVPGLGRRVAPTDDLRAFRHVLARLRELRPDVVHTHTAKAGILGRVASRLLGLPVVHTYHGHVLHGYFPRVINRAIQGLERVVAGDCHHHALTPGQVRELYLRFGVGRGSHWHGLPVPVAPVAPRRADWHAQLVPGAPVVGFLGRLVAIKDGDLYLDVLARLAQRGPVQGVVCGDGVLREPLEARAHALGLRVRFTGFVPAAEAFGCFDLLLVTSRNEGQPLAVIEAGSAGVPAVAPPVGGLRDLIRWGGCVGAPRTAEALAAACGALLADAGARERAARRARRLAARLAPGVLVGAYERMYAAVRG